MALYGFDCRGVDVEVEADSLQEAMGKAQKLTGRPVSRGRSLAGYTWPSPGDIVDPRRMEEE